MSKLFDDASLAMIPSAYKDGKLYSIRPVEELGSELVTNGDFATDSYWTKGSGSTISGGSLNIVAAPYNANTKQSISLTNGTAYKISIDYTASGTSTSNTFQLGFGDSAGNPSDTTQHEFAQGSGVKTLNVTAASGDAAIIFRSRDASTSNLSIHNVSVKEVLKPSGDFTFSRGSNLAATRVDVNGLIEKGRENQILHSNAITTSPWGGPRIFSETQGHTGYDGSNNAWLIIPNTDNNTHYKVQSVSTTSGVNTISVYAKAGGYNYMTIRDDSGGSSYAKFDLANGLTQSSGSNDITSKIESVGNGWYRCSLTYLETGTGNVLFYINETYSLSPAYTGDQVSGVYFQDFQVEQGLVATDYIETGASTAQAGILEDMPRLDYSGSCPSLLLEPQRTNIATNSEYMLGFTKGSAASLEANAAISPEGKNNATYFYCNTTTTNAYIVQGWIGTSGVQYAVSFYAKAKELNRIYVKNVNDSGSQSYFDLSNGTFTLLSGIDSMSIEDAGDGWYRCTAVSTSTTTGIKWIPILKGDANEGVYVYGLQIEQGSYPTSYIPCMGTSQTRSVDSGVSDVDSLLTSNATYTWMVEFIVPEVGNGGGEITFKDAGGSSQLRIYCNQNNMVGLRVDDNSQNYYIPVSVGDTAKCLFQCTNGLVKGFYNGVLVKTFNVDTGMDAQKIHLGPPVAAPEVKQVLLFNTALTDSECIALTTL